MTMREAVVVASSRTPLAKSYRGSFNLTRPDDLAAHCINDVMRKRLSVTGSTLRPRPVAEKAAIIRSFEREAMPHFAAGRIAPLIHRVYPLEQAAEAHRTMEASEHFGKLVLRVTGA